MHHVAPLLETARLRLRAFTKDDFEAIKALWTDPEIYRHIMGRPSTQEECWFRLLRYVGHWQLNGYGYWAIELKATGEMIGETGVADFRRTIDLPFGDRLEMGWILSPQYHQQGLAREATEAVLRWYEADRPGSTFVSIITPENKASVKLAERLGFSLSHQAKYNEEMIDVYHRG